MNIAQNIFASNPLIETDRLPLRMFIAGPYVDPSWSPQKVAESCSASQARLHLLKKYRSSTGFQVVIGEEVVEWGKDYLEEENNSVLSEYLVNLSVDCIVILPSSPGSFCELGAWADRKHICDKMLIIVDARFHPNVSSASYINTGVIIQAINHHARVEYVEYTDIEEVTRVADDFVRKMRIRRRKDSLSRASGR